MIAQIGRYASTPACRPSVGCHARSAGTRARRDRGMLLGVTCAVDGISGPGSALVVVAAGSDADLVIDDFVYQPVLIGDPA
jgi:hypothetical protein